VVTTTAAPAAPARVPAGDELAPIVQIATVGATADAEADAAAAGDADAVLQRARAFAEPLLRPQVLDTGENAWDHAEGSAAILAGIGAAASMRAAAYLVYAADRLHRPDEVVAKAFGASYAALVIGTRRLMQIQRAAREAQVDAERHAQQTERVRKMLLAFSRDLRVVLLRLASRLQTLRWHAASRTPCPPWLAQETQQVYAPLANRLGIWQLKWELEDLAFRFLQPDEYKRIAALLDEKRSEREQRLERLCEALAQELARAGVAAAGVQGRPKHLYSIWKKMQGKRLDFAQVLDLSALRVLVADVDACYAALACVHQRYTPVAGEFDDYIARPKPNGYQSLHTVVLDDERRALEVQIRTRAMHEHAEHGVAAHWAYKEAGTRGYAGVKAAGAAEQRVAEARKAVLRQLLAWEREHAQAAGEGAAGDRLYVFTPQAAVVELPVGATPVDFAYSLHTELGHRCRGARVDGRVVPLNTPLAHGQTVEIVAAKEGGPSLDWLNAELGYLASARAKAKVRAWFNALAQEQTVARGREAVERLLQREGRTAVKLDDLAAQLGFADAAALFAVVGKDEYSLRHIEQLLRPAEPPAAADEGVALKRPRADASARGGVLVVGIASLMTTLARCCRPAPPDAIGGYVTRGRGVAVHRADCANFRHMAAQAPERAIAVAWGQPRAGGEAVYPVDVRIDAADRPGLLRDISEVFAREKVNVTGVHTQSVRDGRGDTAWMTFTVEVADAARLQQVLHQVGRVAGVRSARRR
jgi:GTP pyrophosphokinase